MKGVNTSLEFVQANVVLEQVEISLLGFITVDASIRAGLRCVNGKCSEVRADVDDRSTALDWPILSSNEYHCHRSGQLSPLVNHSNTVSHSILRGPISTREIVEKIFMP